SAGAAGQGRPPVRRGQLELGSALAQARAGLLRRDRRQAAVTHPVPRRSAEGRARRCDGRGRVMASRKVVRLARQGVVALAIRFISAVLGYALLVVLARWMGADEFGRFGVAFSLATTVGIICGGGQRRLVLRFVAAYCARGREDLLRPLLRTSLAATAAAAGLAAGAIALTALLLSLDASFYPAALLAAA